MFLANKQVLFGEAPEQLPSAKHVSRKIHIWRSALATSFGNLFKRYKFIEHGKLTENDKFIENDKGIPDSGELAWFAGPPCN